MWNKITYKRIRNTQKGRKIKEGKKDWIRFRGRCNTK